MPSKEQYETLFNSILVHEEAKKSVASTIKNAYDVFATENNVNVKGVKKAFKSYKEILKDRAKFEAEEADYDAATEALLQETTA